MLLVFISVLREVEAVIDIHPYKNPKWSQRQSLTTCWNVNGALQRPKGITNHSKAPNCVLKAFFLISLSWSRIWWNPLTRSIFEKTVEPPSARSMDWMKGKGYQSRPIRIFEAP